MDPNNNSINPNDTSGVDQGVGDFASAGDVDLENIANDVALSANTDPSSPSYESSLPNETVDPQLANLDGGVPIESQGETAYDPNTYSPDLVSTDPNGSGDITPSGTETDYTESTPTEYATTASAEVPASDYQITEETAPQQDLYAPVDEMPVNDNASAENIMQEFNTVDDSNLAPLDPSPLSPPENSSGKRAAMIPLVIITILLFALLLGSIWFFFLRGKDEGPQPTPTPGRTPTAIPTQGPTSTHLECRFGLCVEVPGTGEDKCTSSFDCEQGVISPTTAPITTPSLFPSNFPTTVNPSTVFPTSSLTSTPTGRLTPSPTLRPGTTPTTNPTTAQPSLAPTIRPTTLPTPSPTPISNSIPATGTTETTLIFGSFFLLALGAGFALLRKR